MNGFRRGVVTLAVATLMTFAACGVEVAGPPTAAGAPAPARLAFGTLASLPEHSQEEAQAGISVAEVEIDWSLAEPAEGQFDENYLRKVKENLKTIQATGRTITLEPSLHYTPDWLLAKPDGRMVDELGNISDEGNFIFNQRLRDAAEKYLDKVASEFDFSQFAAVRVTSATDTEVLYPANGHYWAFDRDAQNGPDMPQTMARNPAPGWRPGAAGLPQDKVRAWADWYIGALVDEVNWQIATYSKLGFHGTYLVLTPGVGVRPSEYEQAIQQNLPPGLLGAGGAWQVFYSKLPHRPDVLAYVSSAADRSGNNDTCQPDDRSVPIDSPAILDWSATRWITRLAAEYGFGVAGENPGWDQSKKLNKTYVDLSDNGMMATALRQARDCGFQIFYWAHDEKLWDGTIPFSAYAEHIAR